MPNVQFFCQGCKRSVRQNEQFQCLTKMQILMVTIMHLKYSYHGLVNACLLK